MIDKLHYISQPAGDGSHLTAIKNALAAGCKWIQLRIKDESPTAILAAAIEAVELCKLYNAKLIVNDHPEIALKAGADGVHLGLDDMPVSEARAIVGCNFIIGGTANTIDHIKQRVDEGVNYIGLGPYRFTTTKKKLSPILGLSGYEAIIRQCKAIHPMVPVIAIGGIGECDVPLIKQAGIYGVAMSGAITHAEDRPAIVRNVYEILNAGTTNSVINL